jgi:hypothetical protein
MQTITILTNDYDSYASVSQADIHLTPSLDFETWDANDDDAKGRYLISATRLLDAQTWLPDYDTQTKREAVIGIINASILIANELSNGNTAILGFGEAEAENKRLKAGSVEIENFRNFNSASFTGSKTTQFPNGIFALLKPYLSGASLAASAASFGVSGTGIAGADYGLTGN